MKIVWMRILLFVCALMQTSTAIKFSRKNSKFSENLIRVITGSDSDVDSDGWFALRDAKDFGRSLISLGSLFRKKDAPEEEDEYYADSKHHRKRMSPIMQVYDEACLWSEYESSKASITSDTISDELNYKIDEQNHQLAVFFLQSTFDKDAFSSNNPLLNQFPRTGFQLLDLSKKIFFTKICKDWEFDETEAEREYDALKDRVVPRGFADNSYLLFLKLYNMTNPTWNNDEYLEPFEFEWIKSNLEKCINSEGVSQNKIKWYTDECKERVVAFDQANNFACTPYVEFDFNVKKYDPFLDFVWHIVTSVHAHCFESFQSNIRMWHKYALAMAELIPPEMQLRWPASSKKYTNFYKRVFGPNYQIYLDNMNKCMNAANQRSNVPYLLPRLDGERNTRYAPGRFQQSHD